MTPKELHAAISEQDQTMIATHNVSVYNNDRNLFQVIDRIHYEDSLMVLMIKPDKDDTAGDEITWTDLLSELETTNTEQVVVWDWDNDIRYELTDNWATNDEFGFESLVASTKI